MRQYQRSHCCPLYKEIPRRKNHDESLVMFIYRCFSDLRQLLCLVNVSYKTQLKITNSIEKSSQLIISTSNCSSFKLTNSSLCIVSYDEFDRTIKFVRTPKPNNWTNSTQQNFKILLIHILLSLLKNMIFSLEQLKTVYSVKLGFPREVDLVEK